MKNDNKFCEFVGFQAIYYIFKYILCNKKKLFEVKGSGDDIIY
jgi:hypothetical protein